MADRTLPQTVVSFVHAHFPTLDHIEVLLHLYRGAERDWTAADVARETQRDPTTVATCLRDLTASQLATAREAGGLERYRYAPATAALQANAEGLVDAYNRLPVQLVRSVYERPSNPVQSFADAFRLRRE